MKKRPRLFYGWVILAVCLVTVFLVYGVRWSFSVFYVAILDEFGWSRADTALIFSANIIVYGITSPIAGTLVDRFGPRRVIPIGILLVVLGAVASSQAHAIWQFVILYGIILALGISIAGFVPHTPTMTNWFVRKRGTAIAVVTSGMGLSFLMSFFAQSLISALGWRMSFVILGAIVGVIALPLALFVHRYHPREMGLFADGDSAPAEQKHQAQAASLVVNQEWAATEWSLPKAVRTYRFWALFLALLCMWGMSLNLIVAHQVVFAVDVGYSKEFGALVYALYGIMYAVGNISGLVSDRIGREPAASIGLVLAAMGVGMLLLVKDTSAPWMLYLYSVLFGFGAGLFSPCLTSSAADLFQGKHFGSIYGFIVMGFGVGGAVSPWLGGRIFDVYGSYSLAFVMVIGFILATLVLIWIAGPGRVRRVAGRAPRPQAKRSPS